jgi:hypothetical protein
LELPGREIKRKYAERLNSVTQPCSGRKEREKVKKFSLPPHFNYFQLRERKKKVRKISSKVFLPIGRGGLRWG